MATQANTPENAIVNFTVQGSDVDNILLQAKGLTYAEGTIPHSEGKTRNRYTSPKGNFSVESSDLFNEEFEEGLDSITFTVNDAGQLTVSGYVPMRKAVKRAAHIGAMEKAKSFAIATMPNPELLAAL